MKCKVQLVRSNDWLMARRLETGDNVDCSVWVEVEIANAPMEVRKALLDAGDGKYQEAVEELSYNASGDIIPYRVVQDYMERIWHAIVNPNALACAKWRGERRNLQLDVTFRFVCDRVDREPDEQDAFEAILNAMERARKHYDGSKA